MIFNIIFVFHSSLFPQKSYIRNIIFVRLKILVGNSFARTDERIIERDLRTFSNIICSSTIFSDDDLRSFLFCSLFLFISLFGA